jgi:hypothetical protein
MPWGDSWGNSPWEYHTKLAEAFYAGKERAGGNNRTRVWLNPHSHALEYWCNGAVIAAWLAPQSRVLRAAHKLETGSEPAHTFATEIPQFRVHYADKSEARHLQALGLNAVWQHSGEPFLIEGAAAYNAGWNTKDQWQAMKKWVRPAKAARPRAPEFVDLTLPLPGFA